MPNAEQWEFMTTVAKPFEEEYQRVGGKEFGVDARSMSSFAPANGLVLYSIIRHFRPRRMIEVGSGMSTRIAAAAFQENAREGSAGRYTVIDPYPSAQVRRGIPGVSDVVLEKVEETSPDPFLQLDANDILFIDSSHAVKVFGDVNHLFLTIVPQLRPGVLIHVHDIFFPRDYLPHHFIGRSAPQIWQEQYLLHAFLMFNEEFEVLLASSYLHFRYLDELKQLFSWYHPQRCPSSFWMRRRIR
jgi:predicted O-methyltransferase YrrM